MTEQITTGGPGSDDVSDEGETILLAPPVVVEQPDVLDAPVILDDHERDPDVAPGTDDDERDIGTGRFAALAIRPYRPLFISTALMFFAINGQQIARGWLAIDLTGSNAGVGAVFLAFGLPMLLLSPIGGVVADRFPKKRVLGLCQATILVAALMIAVADAVGLLAYWMLIAASVVHGAGLSMMGPARMAFTGEVVGHRALPNAVMLQQMAMNSTRVIGPAIAGALIGVSFIGAGGVYMFTSALIVGAIWFTSRLPTVPVRVAADRASPFGQLVDGLRYVRARPQVLRLLVTSSIMVIVGFQYVIFLPYLAKDVFHVGSSGFGLMATVSACAAVASTFWLAGKVSKGSVWHLQSLCGVGFGVGLLLLAGAPTFLVALVVLFLLGGAVSGYQATNSALVLTETSLEYHGRVQSLLATGFASSAVIALPLGVLADVLGLRVTLFGMGVICTVTITVYILSRRRDVRRGVAAT